MPAAAMRVAPGWENGWGGGPEGGSPGFRRSSMSGMRCSAPRVVRPIRVTGIYTKTMQYTLYIHANRINGRTRRHAKRLRNVRRGAHPHKHGACRYCADIIHCTQASDSHRPRPAFDIYTLPYSTTSASEARRADYAGLTCTHESVEVRSVGGNGCGVCEMRIADMHTN